MTRFHALLAVLPLLLPNTAFAKVELCRQINNRHEREACYKRQDAARLEAQKAASAKPKAPSADQVKAENERMSGKMKGICKNC